MFTTLLAAILLVVPYWVYTVGGATAWQSVICDPAQCTGNHAVSLPTLKRVHFIGFHTAGSAKLAAIRLAGLTLYTLTQNICEAYDPPLVQNYGATVDARGKPHTFRSCGSANIGQLRAQQHNCYHTTVHSLQDLEVKAYTHKGMQRVPCHY